MEEKKEQYYWGIFDVSRTELADLMRKIANQYYIPEEDYCGIVVIQDEDDEKITVIRNLYADARIYLDRGFLGSSVIGVISAIEAKIGQDKPVMIGAEIFSDDPIFWRFISDVEETYKMYAGTLPGTKTIPLPKPHIENPSMEIVQRISQTAQMKCYYKDYNPGTAREILKAIPKAWQEHKRWGKRWGPGIIGKKANLTSAVISRYLSAFRKAGITEIVYEDETIPIPHNFRSNMIPES